MTVSRPRPGTSQTSRLVCRPPGTRRRPSTVPVRRDEGCPAEAAMRAASAGFRRCRTDQVQGLRAFPSPGCRMMLEQHERGSVPTGAVMSCWTGPGSWMVSSAPCQKPSSPSGSARCWRPRRKRARSRPTGSSEGRGRRFGGGLAAGLRPGSADTVTLAKYGPPMPKPARPWNAATWMARRGPSKRT